MAEITGNSIVTDTLVSASSSAEAVGFLVAGHPALGIVTGLWACKPIRQAILRFISGSIEIPEAWLRNQKRMIKAKGASELQIMEKFAKEAVKSISESSSLKIRAESYAEAIIEKKQATRENIARKTLGHLAVGNLPEEVSAPSEDFMRSFEGVAEKASSEELQDMMARILAGEIRKPGSVSRVALSIADILDKKIIESMLFIKPYIIGGSWICVDSLDFKSFSSHAELLSSVRITTEMGMRNYGFSESGYTIHPYASGAILIELKNKSSGNKFHPQADGFNISMPGKELMSLLPDQNVASIETIAESYRKNQYLGDIRVGKLETKGDRDVFVPDPS